MSENLERVRSFIEAWQRNDVDELMGYFADDCVYHNIPVEPVRGLEATGATIKGFASMATSEVLALRDMGIVGSVALLAALLADFFLAPALYLLTASRARG